MNDNSLSWDQLGIRMGNHGIQAHLETRPVLQDGTKCEDCEVEHVEPCHREQNMSLDMFGHNTHGSVTGIRQEE